MTIARTDDERAYADSLRRFCDREVAPHARAVDRGERSIWESYRSLGKAGLLAPADGGLPMLAIFMAELSRACPSTALSCGASVVLGGGTILKFGSDEQKRKWLPAIAAGRAIACLGLTEPGAGSDVMSLSTKARREGDTWVLRGQKTFITNAPDADVFVIYAVTGDEGGKKTLGTFLVEKGAAGLSTGRPMAKMGMRGSPTSEVTLEDARGVALGDPKRGFAQAMWPLTQERAMAPAMAIGVLESCLDRCIRYAQTRVQFGKPIAAFQAVQFKIARIYRDIALLTAMLHEVLDGLAAGRDLRKEISAAKIFAGEAAVHGALEAIQVFGGYGYIEESEVERALRDVKLLEIGAGTTEIQYLVIARELLGEAAR